MMCFKFITVMKRLEKDLGVKTMKKKMIGAVAAVLTVIALFGGGVSLAIPE